MLKTDKSEIRTRFAPSPTGSIHLGAIRTALFNYYYAKRHQGSFILRIEDTDLARHVAQSETEIYKTLEWLGLLPDEGPQVGGEYGPYRQSERLSKYKEVIAQLIADKKAYPCFCDDQELKLKQRQAAAAGIPYIYDGKCRGLAEHEVRKYKESKHPYSVRFCVPNQKVKIKDLVQGLVIFDSRLIGDFIIFKSNGFPSYNFAVVVDDHAMKISHIIRGVGHLSNTPRQILLYQELGYPLPEFSHISEIVGPDRKKLSKRRGAIPVLSFEKLGYLPEALKNYLGLLGWYPKDGVELFSQAVPPDFDLRDCAKSPALLDIFLKEEINRVQKKTEELKRSDELPWYELAKQLYPKSKLNHLNNLYLLQEEPSDIYQRIKNLFKDEKSAEIQELLADKRKAQMELAIGYLAGYVSRITEFPKYLNEIFFPDWGAMSAESRKILYDAHGLQVIGQLVKELRKLENPDKQRKNPQEIYRQALKDCGKTMDCSGRRLYLPIRLAMTGKTEGLEIPLIFVILGRDETLIRLKKSLGQ